MKYSVSTTYGNEFSIIDVELAKVTTSYIIQLKQNQEHIVKEKIDGERMDAILF